MCEVNKTKKLYPVSTVKVVSTKVCLLCEGNIGIFVKQGPETL